MVPALACNPLVVNSHPHLVLGKKIKHRATVSVCLFVCGSGLCLVFHCFIGRLILLVEFVVLGIDFSSLFCVLINVIVMFFCNIVICQFYIIVL